MGVRSQESGSLTPDPLTPTREGGRSNPRDSYATERSRKPVETRVSVTGSAGGIGAER